MYGYNTTQADTRAAMQTLKDRGIAKVVIEFSGGNDEGGADGVDYFDAEGNKIPGIEGGNGNIYERNHYDPIKRQNVNEGWVVSTFDGPGLGYTQRPATADEIALAKVEQVLEAPIYVRYGSFAGEFHAYGNVTWDVATGEHKMSGQESHEVYESF